MASWISHRDGSTDEDLSDEALVALLAELDAHDPEHPDVSISHESGWTLGAYGQGRVAWENVEELDTERHQSNLSDAQVLDLFRAVGRDDLAMVEAQPWLPGYPR